MSEARVRYSIQDLADFVRGHAITMDMHDGGEAGSVTIFFDKDGVSKFKQVDECMGFMAQHEETIKSAVKAVNRKPKR